MARPRSGSRRDHANERSVDPDVTTSLRPSAAPERGRVKRHVALPQPVEVTKTHNGVPRSNWFRSIPRLSTWHRPYAVLLVVLDYAATALASLTAIAIFEQADSGFEVSPQVFTLVAYVGLPLGWLIILWGHGAYDRRYLGHRLGRVQAHLPHFDHRGRDVSSPQLRPEDRPVPVVGRHRVGRLTDLHHDRAMAGSPAPGGYSRPWSCGPSRPPDRHVRRGVGRLRRGDAGAGRRAGSGRHPPHRGVRAEPGGRLSGAQSSPGGMCSAWSGTWTLTRSPSAGRPGPSQANCAGSRGNSRARASTSSWHRS